MANDAAVQPRTALPAHISTALRDLRPTIGPLLPPDITEEQFRAALYLELNSHLDKSGRPALYDCTPESLRTCAIKAATYGLLPGRDCHFLPFVNRRNGGKKEATYIPNYQGIILALERSGKVRRAFAHPVHEGDIWEFDTFADRPVHKPAVTLGKKPGRELFYYGAIMFKDGTCAFEVLTLEELDAIKRSSPAHEYGPWVEHPVMMKRKSAIKRVAKYVRLTPQQAALLADDDTRERDDIPEERHRSNVVDLFGDRDEVSAAQQAARNVTPQREAEPDPDPQTTGEQAPEWYALVQQHAHLATGELAIQVKEALSIPGYSHEAGSKLAMVLCDLAAAQQEA